MLLDIKLPWPPSANRYWRYVHGRVLTSREAKNYKALIQGLAYFWKPKHLTGRLKVKIIAHVPDKRIRDLDNLQKITLDSLQDAGVFKNDSQIDDLHTIRGPMIKGGLLHVNISTFDDRGSCYGSEAN